jgi:protein SCO1/2
MLLRRLIYLSVAIFAVAAIWFQIAMQKSPKLETYKQVPDFQLTERSGKTVTLADLKGKIWVANFFYASCPGPCPMISTRLDTLQDDVLKNNDDVRLVSISTQPDMDTPEVLRQYANRFHASDKWLFLTGDKAQIFNLSNKGFLLTAADQNDPTEVAAPVIHSTKLALVDKSGNIRGYYDGADEANIKLLADDIKKLLRE